MTLRFLLSRGVPMDIFAAVAAESRWWLLRSGMVW